MLFRRFVNPTIFFLPEKLQFCTVFRGLYAPSHHPVRLWSKMLLYYSKGSLISKKFEKAHYSKGSLTRTHKSPVPCRGSLIRTLIFVALLWRSVIPRSLKLLGYSKNEQRCVIPKVRKSDNKLRVVKPVSVYVYVCDATRAVFGLTKPFSNEPSEYNGPFVIFSDEQTFGITIGVWDGGGGALCPPCQCI